MPPMHGWWQSLSQGPYIMRFQPRDIWRARAAYRRTQKICVQYRIYSFEYPITNKWLLAWSRSGGCVAVRPGYRAVFDYYDFFTDVSDKAYNAEVWVNWYVGRRRIAAGHWSYNTTADYRCQTLYCHVDVNNLYNLAFMMFDYNG